MQTTAIQQTHRITFADSASNIVHVPHKQTLDIAQAPKARRISLHEASPEDLNKELVYKAIQLDGKTVEQLLKKGANPNCKVQFDEYEDVDIFSILAYIYEELDDDQKDTLEEIEYIIAEHLSNTISSEQYYQSLNSSGIPPIFMGFFSALDNGLEIEDLELKVKKLLAHAVELAKPKAFERLLKTGISPDFKVSFGSDNKKVSLLDCTTEMLLHIKEGSEAYNNLCQIEDAIISTLHHEGKIDEEKILSIQSRVHVKKRLEQTQRNALTEIYLLKQINDSIGRTNRGGLDALKEFFTKKPTEVSKGSYNKL